MFILKNAWISITRNKGRNILIGVVILVIACATTITLAINNTAKDLINSYESIYDKELTISFDRTSMRKDFDFSKEGGMEEARDAFSNITSYTLDDIISFSQNEHILDYKYTYSLSLNGNNISKAESDTASQDFGRMDRGEMQRGGMEQLNQYDFTLTGYSGVEAMSEFVDGTYKIESILDDAWNIAFSGNYVFINQELAEYNGLDLNSIIELADEEGNIYSFEVIGIYSDNEEVNDNGPMDMFSNSVNTLVTNASVLAEIDNSNDTISGMINPTFIIDDYNNSDKIQEAFYELGLDTKYTVSTNEEMATSGLTSIENVKNFASTFLIITFIIGGIVLFVINMINIRERKYEIGVLRTIGISKVKLTMQFVSELLIVALIALILGAGIGAISSKGISNNLLQNEIESSNEKMDEVKENFGGKDFGDKMDKGDMPGKMQKMGGAPVVQAYTKVDAVVDGIVILELLGLGISLVLISSVASMISIQRFSPLTILKERS